MKKYISKLCILLVSVMFVMIAVSCGKADSTNKTSDTLESSKDLAKDEVKETPENTAPTEKAEPTESADIAVNPEPTDNAETTINTEPLENTEQLVEMEPIVITDLEIIAETVLFDQDGIRVTAKDFMYDSVWRKQINLLIENDTDKNIGMMINTLVVNNCMIDDFYSCGIASRTTINEAFPLSSVGMSVIGINAISEVAISFKVFDNDSGETLFISKEVVIQTSEYGEVEQPNIEDGKELWNQAGVRVVGNYLDENSPWGTAVLLYIENTSQVDVLIQCDDMFINGFAATPYFFCLVKKGRIAIDALSITSDNLESNGIREIKDIGITLSIVDPTQNKILYQSEPLQLLVEE